MQLQSNDIATKITAIGSLMEKLKIGGKSLDLQSNDTKVRLYSAAVGLMKDANPKVFNTGFDLVSMFIEDNAFQPLLNMAFDILLVKFGNAKLNIN